MHKVTTTMSAVVTAPTGAEFERLLNERLAEIGKFNPQITFNTNEGHCAYLVYTQEVRVADNARDTLELQGVFITCADCPYLTDEVNSKGHYRCARGHTSPEQRACLWFSDRFLKGEETCKN